MAIQDDEITAFCDRLAKEVGQKTFTKFNIIKSSRQAEYINEVNNLLSLGWKIIASGQNQITTELCYYWAHFVK